MKQWMISFRLSLISLQGQEFDRGDTPEPLRLRSSQVHHPKYREDQFYLGINFNLLLDFPEGVNQNGLSYGFQGGFIRDFPLNKACTFALG